MIFITNNIKDNFIIMWGTIKKIFLFVLLLCGTVKCYALEKVGVLTDTVLTPTTYYSAYYRTPAFFAEDIRAELLNRNVEVISLQKVKEALLAEKVTQKEVQALQGLQQGYNINYPMLRKIRKRLGINKLVIVTMGMDIQRDFLKNTLWNSANIPGFDVVNPTHRVSVYVSLVDINQELVLWESIYAKNIRNNKMKNLDTTVANNYEGMLRLKEYSRYISPDVAYNVKMKMLNSHYVEAPTYITKENIKQYVKDKHNIGVKKELSEIDRKKWDTAKLSKDTKANIKDKAHKAKVHIKSGFNKFKGVIIRKKKQETVEFDL